MDIQGFWDAVLKQDADRMRAYFCRDAYILHTQGTSCSNDTYFYSL